MSKKADMAITLFVLGVLAICGLALLSFSVSKINFKQSLAGVGLMEEMNLKLEENFFNGKEIFPISLNETASRGTWKGREQYVVFSVESFGP